MKTLWMFLQTSLLLCIPMLSHSELVSVIEGIKVKDNKHSEALFYYQNNWQAFRQLALQRRYIEAFEFIDNTSDTNPRFDILLVTKYKDAPQHALAEDRFAKIIAESGQIKLLNKLKPEAFRESAFAIVGTGVSLQNILANTQLKTEPKTQPETEPNTPVKETVIEGLAHPWSMAFLSEHEALVTEKNGQLVRVNLQTKQVTPIQNFPNDLANTLTVDASKYEPGIYPEQLNGRTGSFNLGIFDIVLDPDFATNRRIFISYSAKIDDTFTTKVISAHLRQDALHDVKSIFVATPYTAGAWHFGGGLVFGNDGLLYITIGERLFNEVNQPAMPIAQDETDKRGKIHRIHTDGSIPQDNPVLADGQTTSIYALGIRAAQGMTLDPRTGNIWFSEHGTHQGDEINLLTTGANYGWPVKTTGTYRFKEYQAPKLSNREFSDPVWYWHHTVAPTGLTFYSGDDFPEWKNSLFVSGLSRGSLWRLSIEDNTVTSLEELFVNDRVRSRKVVQSPQGKLYILTDEDNGKIVKIRRAKK